jgi:hypothetical protein
MKPNEHNINNLERYMFETLSDIDKSFCRLGRLSQECLIPYKEDIQNEIIKLQRIISFIEKRIEK